MPIKSLPACTLLPPHDQTLQDLFTVDTLFVCLMSSTEPQCFRVLMIVRPSHPIKRELPLWTMHFACPFDESSMTLGTVIHRIGSLQLYDVPSPFLS
ncbi:hypothetical protein O181_024839 [Austropuccinia psidii MF-1]|uniref:Uncharacterized protein n=1 Tax=Austropuccinia psidii MF-1 TaxID=1389203 RepID=A0A9Q3H021_9BASI|nr:hypothetical protein [Austropuccinia psidii MF-1]